MVIIGSVHCGLNTWVVPNELTQGGTPRPRNKQQERNRLEEPAKIEKSGKKIHYLKNDENVFIISLILNIPYLIKIFKYK